MVTGDRKKRVLSRFLYEILGPEVTMFSALFANLMRGVSNKASVSIHLPVTCHLSPVTSLLLSRLATCRRGCNLKCFDDATLNADSQCGSHLILDSFFQIVIFLQRCLGIFAALAQTFAFVGKPCSTLFHHPVYNCKIEHIAFARNSLAVHDVKFTLSEWRSDFILNHLNLSAITGNLVTFFNRADAANIKPQRRIELQRTASGSRFGTSKHYANLFANLIDEDKAGIGLCHDCGQFSQCLRHQ